MKIISNERYKKLKDVELWEEVKALRGYSLIEPDIEKCSVEDYIKWLLCDRISEFLSVNDYSVKPKKGEIGKLFGKSIIVK